MIAELITMEDAVMMDSILKRFDGNGKVYWDALRAEFKLPDGTYSEEYYLTENNIKILLGENVLKQMKNETYLEMTDRGFGIYTHLESMGFVAQRKKYESKKCLDLWTFVVVLIGSIASIVGIILSLYK
jgi:hypothetical protein